LIHLTYQILPFSAVFSDLFTSSIVPAFADWHIIEHFFHCSVLVSNFVFILLLIPQLVYFSITVSFPIFILFLYICHDIPVLLSIGFKVSKFNSKYVHSLIIVTEIDSLLFFQVNSYFVLAIK